jgi:hypothetical protein
MAEAFFHQEGGYQCSTLDIIGRARASISRV